MAEIATSRKTTGLTALGVISVILGALLIIGSLAALLQPEAISRTAEKTGVPSVLTGINLAFAYIDAMVNTVLAILLFTAGIGILMLRKWGAKLAIWYSWTRIVWSVIGFIFVFIGPLQMKEISDFSGYNQNDPMIKKLAEYMANWFPTIVITQAVAGLLLSCAFAVILICLLKRESYRNELS